ncbi:MAG: hypothetical protein J5793_02475, partial [Clostridia bacterium]|nr:hypothetical protein [Clostridia bacterium]
MSANDVFSLALENDAAPHSRRNDAMFARFLNVPQARIMRVSAHHCRRQHHLPARANIIQKLLVC